MAIWASLEASWAWTAACGRARPSAGRAASAPERRVKSPGGASGVALCNSGCLGCGGLPAGPHERRNHPDPRLCPGPSVRRRPLSHLVGEVHLVLRVGLREGGRLLGRLGLRESELFVTGRVESESESGAMRMTCDVSGRTIHLHAKRWSAGAAFQIDEAGARGGSSTRTHHNLVRRARRASGGRRRVAVLLLLGRCCCLRGRSRPGRRHVRSTAGHAAVGVRLRSLEPGSACRHGDGGVENANSARPRWIDALPPTAPTRV